MQVKDVTDRQVLEGYTVPEPRPFITTYLEAQGIPEKVAERKVEQLVRRGYLDWGVSIRTSFLTEAGRAYMRELGLTPAPPPTWEAMNALARATLAHIAQLGLHY